MTKEQAVKIKRELELIRRADESGRTRPEAVVEYARDPTTELHKHFEWNDGSAAASYRLDQARELIRVQVTLLDPGDGREIEVRAFVSMRPGEGYLETVDVFSSKRGRRELLLKILDRMLSIAQSYAMPELRPIVRAIGTTQKTLITASKRGRRRPVRSQDARVSM
jgi:hypothetical protein